MKTEAATYANVAFRNQNGIDFTEWRSVHELFADAFDNDWAYEPQNVSKIAERLSDFNESVKSSYFNYHDISSLRAALACTPKSLLDAVQAMRDEIDRDVSLPTTQRRKVRRGCDIGDELDVDRWSSFDPNCWDRSERVESSRPIVRLAVNVAVLANRLQSDVVYRGAAVMALADHLIRRGANVEIVGFAVSARVTYASDLSVSTVVLKPGDSPLDAGTIVLAICDIAVFRAAIMLARVRHLPGEVHKGWGFTATIPVVEREKFDFVADSDIFGKRAAVDWLKSSIRKFEGANR